MGISFSLSVYKYILAFLTSSSPAKNREFGQMSRHFEQCNDFFIRSSCLRFFSCVFLSCAMCTICILSTRCVLTSSHRLFSRSIFMVKSGSFMPHSVWLNYIRTDGEWTCTKNWNEKTEKVVVIRTHTYVSQSLFSRRWYQHKLTAFIKRNIFQP